MRRWLIIAVLAAAGSLPASAQHWSLHLSGWAGFGFQSAGTTSGVFENTARDFTSDVYVAADGFLYDPRLVSYNVSMGWNRASTGVEQGDTLSRGLNLNASASFLSERSFPFSVFYTRSSINADSDLFPLYETSSTLWGVRGVWKQPQKFGVVAYNFTSGSTANDLPDGTSLESRYRNMNLSWNRRWAEWDLRAGWDNNFTANGQLGYEQRMSTFSFDAGRAFGDKLRLDASAMYSSFGFDDVQSNQIDSGVLTVNGTLSWKHTEKLDSYYTASIARNAINAFQLQEDTSGGMNPLPFTPLVSSTLSQSFGTGVNYRWTERLTLTANAGYSRYGIGDTDALTDEQKRSLTTGAMNAGGGYTYQRPLWKLQFRSSGSLQLQSYTLLLDEGGGGTGIGYSLDNGVSGGSTRTVRFTGAYRISRRNNPVFFNSASTTDNVFSVQAETERLPWFRWTFSADRGYTRLELINSDLDMTRSSYTVMATRPKLSLYYARNSSDSDERFFALLPQAGPAGAASRSRALLLPDPLRFVATELHGQRAGVIWRPKPDLQVEGRYVDASYLFTLPQLSESRLRHFDVLATYKWGRFTINGGYGHLLNGSNAYDQSTNRYFIRVRFPFRIM